MMHHVNDDPRCLKSCLLIREALLDLLKENGYNLRSVSVSDIADRATVSRATFYRHFDMPRDVLIWASNREAETAVDATPLINANYQLFCRNFFEYWVSHSDFLETLVAVNHAYIFLYSLELFLEKISPELFRASKLPESRKAFLVSIWSAIVWAILKHWVLDGKQETAEELAVIAIYNLPKPH